MKNGFDLNTRTKEDEACNPSLGGGAQRDPWGSLARQHDLGDEF